MKKIVILIQALTVLMISNCQSQDRDTFLDNFTTLKTMPYSELFKENDLKIEKEISQKNLSEVFHIPINEIDFSDSYQKNKYFYYGKYKLNEDFYLIGYKKFYGYNETKVVFSVYNSNKKTVTSSLVFSDELKVNRRTNYKDGFFYIKSTYNEIPNGLDPEPGKEFLQKTILEKYSVNENYIFEKQKI